jgi:predicted RNA-binding protein with PUA-like domain
LVADGRTNWDGVRNAQALNNMRAMKLGPRFLSFERGKEIVGIVEVIDFLSGSHR